MADTVSKNMSDDEYKEYIDTPSVRKKKIQELAEMIKKHRGRVIFFTGAGISTAAGIPDFRSGVGSATGLPAGKWCHDATKDQLTAEQKQVERERRKKTVSCLQAIPTKSHMALVELKRRGIVLGLVSQNCDGLHRRSGFDPNSLAELHGNTNLEYCGWCGKEYFRDFSTYQGRHSTGAKLKKKLWKTHQKLDLLNPRSGNHYTGRRCLVPGCDGYLFDSTIDFGDNLPEKHIDRGFALGDRATLCVVLGSRCSVSPACDIPIGVGKRKDAELVCINLQKTAADRFATLRIGAKIDDVMVPLMKILNINIPTFVVRRRIKIERVSAEDNEGDVLRVKTIGADGLPDDALWNVQTSTSSEKYPEGEAKASAARITAGSVHVKMNKDAAFRGRRRKRQSDVPEPGDTAKVLVFPWLNSSRPGMVDVRMLTGDTRGEIFSLDPSICDVLDAASMNVRSDGMVRVVNGGSCNGEDLHHAIPLSRRHHVASMVTLMFRAHYGETPLVLPVPPKSGDSYVANCTFDPMRRVWSETVSSEDASPDMSALGGSKSID
eukprot:g109.t1